MSEEIIIPKNQEIDDALKEFEVKSQDEQAKKTAKTLATPAIPAREVEGVGFDDVSYGAIKYYKETAPPKIVKMVIKLSGGAVKDQKQAEYILLGFVVVTLAVSGFLIFNSFKNSSAKPLSNVQVEQIIKNQQGVQTP